MDGSIERGYSGNSFFFENDEILIDERTVTYASLLASVGINGAVINNVNVKDAATWLITDRYVISPVLFAVIYKTAPDDKSSVRLHRLGQHIGAAT